MRLYDETMPEIAPAAEPNLDELRHHGWAVNLTVGRYCYAWRGQEEALFVWRGEAGWMLVPGRGSGRQAA